MYVNGRVVNASARRSGSLASGLVACHQAKDCPAGALRIAFAVHSGCLDGRTYIKSAIPLKYVFIAMLDCLKAIILPMLFMPETNNVKHIAYLCKALGITILLN